MGLGLVRQDALGAEAQELDLLPERPAVKAAVIAHILAEPAAAAGSVAPLVAWAEEAEELPGAAA
jgi:hypothetical protein